MKKTIGILAHVDAGKTTFSEQLLYNTHRIRTRGRVDEKNTVLDSHEIERKRGITIFSGQSSFEYKDNTYYLVDTPGHVDFSPETERAISVMDYAVVLLSSVEGIQAHTQTLWGLLEHYRVPVFFFLNKTDRQGANPEGVIADMQAEFSERCVDVSRLPEDREAVLEAVAPFDDVLLEAFLEENMDADMWSERMGEMIRRRQLFPCFLGSALQNKGIDAFLEVFDTLTSTEYESKEKQPFWGRVYRVSHDSRGGRVAFLKICQGTLHAKEEIAFANQNGETEWAKVDELRVYSGDKYETVKEASAGELCAAVGLSGVHAGDRIGAGAQKGMLISEPMLSAGVQAEDGIQEKKVLEAFRTLEDEEPMLCVESGRTGIRVRVMGKIQLEVLEELIPRRFGFAVSFGKCKILYKETIRGSVVGSGHFEPLRHYAEVHLRLSQGEAGSGIVFDSVCPLDVLERSYQHLVRTHVFEKEHKGVLTGAPLTDVRITLLVGRAHLKHTEGGDFREAVYRAVRHGLMQAESVLLEPYYDMKLTVPSEYAGRVLSDIQRMHGVFDVPQTIGESTQITASVPASECMEYPRELSVLTGAKARIQMRSGGYKPCHNADEVIAAAGYDAERDVENTPDSVFCSHGSGFPVKWNEAAGYMHCEIK